MRLVSLKANFAGFHSINFNDATSFIVAEREHDATRTDSRNGLGKSSSIALIDFCLGGSPSRQVTNMAGNSWKFTLELVSRRGARLNVSRSPDAPSDIIISGDRARAGLLDTNTADDRPLIVGTTRWNKWLLQECFPDRGVPAPTPSFRSLIRHFIRYRREAFIDPFRTITSPSAEALQAENAYLLGLDWRIAGEWAALREHAARLKALDVEEVTLDEKIASVESKLARNQSRLTAVSIEIAEFSIVPEYREIELRANQIARDIKALTNENIADQQMASLYRSQLGSEFAGPENDVELLFKEAGIQLGEVVVRGLAEATEFFSQVSANRASYLEDEIARLEGRILRRQAERERRGDEQRDLLQALQSGGALEDFAELQRRLAEIQADVTVLERQLNELNRISERRSTLKADQIELAARSRRDLTERFERRAEVLTRFADILDELYGEPAELHVTLGKSGLQFKTTLPRTGSGGVDSMAIFAYDIAITEAFAREQIGPGLLIHDSPLFADVDERQIAGALRIAVASSEAHGYQYIAALNSDKIPWDDLPSPTLITDRIVLSLNDASVDGSLLGVRINADREDSDEDLDKAIHRASDDSP